MGGAGTKNNGKPAFYRTQNKGILVTMVDFAQPSPPTYLNDISQFTPMKLAIHHLLIQRFSMNGGIAPLMLNTRTENPYIRVLSVMTGLNTYVK